MFKMKKVNILGSEWTINIVDGTKSKHLNYGRLEGKCRFSGRNIYVHNFMCFKDLSTHERNTAVNLALRHELIHAFLSESGLNNSNSYDGSWVNNEEMVDWLAIQSPKIFKVYEELGILED